MLPTNDEITLIKNYTGDFEELAAPEKFVSELIKVPDFRNRLKSLMFLANYEETLYELNQKISDLSKGFSSVYENERLHHILEVTLAVSNYLNGTGPRGGAWGIKLDSL